MNERDLLRDLVSQLRPQHYLSRTNDWIRGSLPRSSFRVGSPSPERPVPAVDRTDRDVLAERQQWRMHYLAVAYWVEHGNPKKAAAAATKALHIEHVALDPKPGLDKEAGWPCVNYLHSYAGEICWTKVNPVAPNVVCQACRDRKCRVEKQH